MPFTIDPEVGAAMQALMGPNPPPKSARGDWKGRREVVHGTFSALSFPVSDSVKTKDFYAKAEDGHEILCRWYTKEGTSSGSPAVVYYHGGGKHYLALHLRRHLNHNMHCTHLFLPKIIDADTLQDISQVMSNSTTHL